MPVDPRPVGPVDFILEPWTRDPNKGVTTRPVVTFVVSPSGRTGGGETVTVHGLYFRTLADGTLPIVTFGGIAGTNVVVVDSNTITVTVPAGSAAGTVDVTVTVGSESGTLLGGYLYFSGRIRSIDPPYAQLSGGSVTVLGSNFVSGSTFTFGGAAATDVTFIDESHIALTVPAHAVGWVDVVYTEPGGATDTLRNGFQYTALTRGSDIRRMPGITINKQSGSQGNNASFVVDGQSNKPVAGEEITISDEHDANRQLFKGVVMTVDQIYEGQTDQLAWQCSAQDFLFFLNRRRPFGSYTNVSVSEIVIDIINKYAPSFSTAFVQTKLALMTISLDGTRTIAEVFDTLAQAIGGGRWYLDGYVLHFFHPPLPDDIVVPIDTGGGADFTAAVLSTGAATNSPALYPAGYYAVRCTFIYSNGVESRLGPASNIMPFDGSKYMHIASLPIGLNPSGTITCVARKIYYYKGTDPLASGWTVTDNTTTTIDVTPVAGPTTGVVQVDVGDPVTIPDTGSPGTVTQPPPSGTEAGLGIPMRGGLGFSGHVMAVGGSMLATGPIHGFLIASRLRYAIYRFKVSVVYANGSESQLSTFTQPFPFGPVPVGGNQSFTYSNGQVFLSRGFDVWCWDSPDADGSMDIFPGCPPMLFKFYASPYQVPAPGVGGGWNPSLCYNDPDNGYQAFGICPYFKTMDQPNHNPIDPSPTSPPNTPLDTTIPIPELPTDFGDKPVINPDDPTQTLVWPNPDGPYLENFTPPDDITNSNPDLLHEDSGSQPFVSSEDITQLRNRVKVYGSGTSTVAAAAIGDNQIQVADASVFSINGGTLLSGNGVPIVFFSTSSLPTGNFVLLSQSLTAEIPEGTILQYYAEANNRASQLERGKIELDVNGNPTDGIHEYVINDSSLATPQQVYLRAQAELHIFAKPIINIKYATRDVKTRVGALVHVDMTDPPCFGDFLIQSVTIDQIHDESDTLMPRYTVQASTVRYELNSFLLALNLVNGQSGSSGGGGNPAGLVPAAAASNTSVSVPIPIGSTTAAQGLGKRVMWWQQATKAASGLTNLAVGQPGTITITGGSFLNDNDGYWQQSASSAGSQAQWTAPTSFARFELEPLLRARFRLTTATFPARVLVSLNAGPTAVNTDTPNLTSERGVYLRYSQIAGDSGWRLMCVSAAGIFLSDVIMPVQRVTTIYKVQIKVTVARDTSGVIILPATFSVTATITNETTGVTASVTMTDGIQAATEVGYAFMVQGVTVPSTSATLDMQSYYLEAN
jgi:hypothetical protein